MAKITLDFDNSLQLQAIGCNDDDLGAAVKGAILYASDIDVEPQKVLHECRESEMFIFGKLCAAIDARKEHAKQLSEARRKAIEKRWNKRNTNQ